MSKFVCQNGVLYLFGTDFKNGSWCVNNVTVEIAANVVSYACMGTDGWLENISGTKTATFTWETALSDTLGVDLDATIGTTAALLFETVDGLSYSAQVVITSISISAPGDDVATVSWTGTADGILRES